MGNVRPINFYGIICIPLEGLAPISFNLQLTGYAATDVTLVLSGALTPTSLILIHRVFRALVPIDRNGLHSGQTRQARTRLMSSTLCLIPLTTSLSAHGGYPQEYARLVL